MINKRLAKQYIEVLAVWEVCCFLFVIISVVYFFILSALSFCLQSSLVLYLFLSFPFPLLSVCAHYMENIHVQWEMIYLGSDRGRPCLSLSLLSCLLTHCQETKRKPQTCLNVLNPPLLERNKPNVVYFSHVEFLYRYVCVDQTSAYY